MLRTLLLSTLLVLVHGALLRGDQGEAEPGPTGATSLAWVRTASGWERPEQWSGQHYPRPALHPFVVAGGQLLGSLLALVAFNAPRQGANSSARKPSSPAECSDAA